LLKSPLTAIAPFWVAHVPKAVVESDALYAFYVPSPFENAIGIVFHGTPGDENPPVHAMWSKPSLLKSPNPLHARLPGPQREREVTISVEDPRTGSEAPGPVSATSLTPSPSKSPETIFTPL
jgi:hypothetical protein